MTTETRNVDPSIVYRPGHAGAQRVPVTYWPTNAVAQRMISPEVPHRVLEREQLSVFLAFATLVHVTLFQVGWSSTTAIVTWSVVSIVSFAVMCAIGVAQQASWPVKAWTVCTASVFLLVNYFACACAPFEATGGRFLISSLFALSSVVVMEASTTVAVILAAYHLVVFVALASLEGSGVRCYASMPSGIPAVAQSFCQLYVGVCLLSAAALNTQLSQRRDDARAVASDAFASRCIEHALQGNIDALVQTVEQFGNTTEEDVPPVVADNALSVVVDLLQKTAKAVEEARNRRPSSRSPSQHGLLVVPQGANSASSDEEGSGSGVAGQKRRRSSTRLLSLDAGTAPILPPFPTPEKGDMVLACFSLPNLAQYNRHADFNVDLGRMFLTEFVDHVRNAVSRYNGVICFSMFSNVYARFPTAQAATAAGVCLSLLLKRTRTHHPEAVMHDTRVLYPLSLVLHASAFLGSYGSGALGSAVTLGHSEMEPVFHRIFEMRSSREIDQTAEVIVPASFQADLRTDFTLTNTSHAQLLAVSNCLSLDFEELPMITPTGNAVGATPTLHALPSLPNSAPPKSNSDSLDASPGDGPRTSKRRSSARPTLPPDALSAWEKYDTDGSGSLDIEEVRQIFSDLGYRITDAEMETFFREVDLDGSGAISKDEYAAAFSNPNIGGYAVMDRISKAGTAFAKSRGGDAVAAVLEAWQRYDKDNSGSLDYTELANLLQDLGMGQSQVELEWLVKKLDRDESGYVDFEEFSALFSDRTVSRQVAAKARSQVVTRVVNNKNSGAIFSNEDQLLRDNRQYNYALSERWAMLPLFVYIGYNCGSITFNLAVGNVRQVSQNTMIADLCFDVALLLWMIVKYLYLPREEKGQILFRRKDVFWHSATTPDFYIDAIAIIPLDFIFIGLRSPVNGDVLAYYRCNKLLLYYYLDDCYKRLAKSFNPALVRAINAMIYFMSFVHIFACGLIVLARSVGENGPGMDNLIGYDYILSETDHTYPIGMYWAVITLVGQNRGNILPLQDSQLVLLILALAIGLPMYAVVLGTIGQAVRVDDSYSKFLDKIDNLRSYFQYTRLPESIENECIAYYRHLYFTTGSLDITENPLADLPIELSIQVVIQIGQEMLRKVPIFQDASKNAEFVHELTTKLVPEVIPPHTTVMTKGERGTNMYFITFGDFNVFSDNGAIVFTLKRGNFFGEIALLHNVKRTATIQSFGKFANVLSLDKKDFDEVTATFPDCLSQVYKAAEDRIKSILAREAEEAQQAKEKRRLEREAQKLAAPAGAVHAISSDDDEGPSLSVPKSSRRASVSTVTQSLSKSIQRKVAS